MLSSHMEVNELAQLLQNETTWKKTNFYKKHLQQDNTNVVDNLLDNLDAIIHGNQFHPMSRLGALRLLKSCLEVGSEFFNFMVQDKDLLDKLIQYSQIKPNSHIFSKKPDKKEISISVTFYTYIVEGFYFWAHWFPDSKFSQIFEQLNKLGVQFPQVHQMQIFKGDQLGLYQNGVLVQKNSKLSASRNKNSQTPALPQQQTPSHGGLGNGITGVDIDQRTTEYVSMRDLLFEMLPSMDEAGDLEMFSESFGEYSRFIDNVLHQDVPLQDQQQEMILDKSEECLEFCQLFEQYYTQRIDFKKLKAQLLQISAIIQQQNMPKESQQKLEGGQDKKTLEAQEKSTRESQDNQKRLEQQQKNTEEEKKKREEQQWLLQQDNLHKEEKRQEADKQRKLEVEREKERARKLEEKQKQDNEEHSRQIQVEKEQKQKEEQRKIQEQKQLLDQQDHYLREQEASRMKQQLHELSRLEEQRLHQNQLQEEQRLEKQREEQRKFLESHKKKDMAKSHITEDRLEDEEEEEFKKNIKISQTKLKQNQATSNQLKKSLLSSSIQDDLINQEGENIYQNYNSNIQQIEHLKRSTKDLIPPPDENSNIGNINTNNLPYVTGGQSKKNPFQQQNENIKAHHQYFFEEEAVAAQKNAPMHQQINQNTSANAQSVLRESQKMDFNMSKDLDDEDEEEEERKVDYADKGKALNNNNAKKKTVPKLEDADFYHTPTPSSSIQVQNSHLQSNIRGDPARPPSNPNKVVNQSQPLFSNGIMSGFEQMSFKPFQGSSSLKNQINASAPYFLAVNKQEDANTANQSSSKFSQALNNTQMWEEKSQIRGFGGDDRINTSASIIDGKRVAVYGKDKSALQNEFNQLRIQFNELRREKDVETNKLQFENNQLTIQLKELNQQVSHRPKDNNGGALNDLLLEKVESQKLLVEKDKIIFQTKSATEQIARDLEQSKQIIKQLEQQQHDQARTFAEKQHFMEEENKKTRAQLEEYISTSQKNYNTNSERVQKNLNQAELDTRKLQAELQQREMENEDLRNEVRLTKSKEQNNNPQLIKEQTSKISELRAKIEILNQETQVKDQKIAELLHQVTDTKKIIDQLKNDSTNAQTQTQLYKENLVQKDIQISKMSQEKLEKEHIIMNKEQSISTLEVLLQKKSEIIEQIKDSSQTQIKKFRDNLDEQDKVIKQLHASKSELEDRLDNISHKHQDEINRIVQASRLSGEEKLMLKKLVEQNDKLSAESEIKSQRETTFQQELTRLNAQLAHIKRENLQLEQNLQDQVQQNNLIAKKLFEKDEKSNNDFTFKEREFERQEKKLQQEIKILKESLEKVQVDKKRGITDLNRTLDTLKKENDLLLNNIQIKSIISPDVSLRSLQGTIAKTDNDYVKDQGNINFFSDQGGQQQIFAQTMQKQVKAQIGNIGEELMSSASQPHLNGVPSLSQSTISARGRRSVTHSKDILFNPLFFSYINGEKNQLYRFKKACLKNKMTVFQDNFINVGVVTELKEIDNKTFLLISLYFENKSLTKQLEQVTINYDGDTSISVFKKPTSLPSVFPENSQQLQQIITGFNEIPYKIILCSLKYSVNNNAYSVVFPIPNSINKYLVIKPEITQQTFDRTFEQNSHLLQRSEEIFVDKNIASSQYDYINHFPGFINLGYPEGLSNFQSLGGQYFLKDIDTNIFLKINFNKRDHKAFFQATFDNQLEEHSLSMVEFLLQTLMMIFRE